MNICGDTDRGLIFRIVLLVGAIIVATTLSWVGLAAAAQGSRTLWGSAGLAYTFGLRHGLDADHITAIDNVTRKLVGDSTHSVTVGAWFSVGHSSVVVVGCLILFATHKALEDQNPTFLEVMDILSASFASFFLILIGIMNLLILIRIYKQMQRMRKEGTYVEETWAQATSQGLIAYCAKPLFKSVDRPWKMFIVGVVFGLGFDTIASVTAVTETATSKMDVSVIQGLMLALIFACGLCTIDSLDGVLMLLTYTWAGISPVRKVYFNFVITGIAVVAALFVGALILLQLISEHTECENDFCDGVGAITDHFEYIGLGLVVLFVGAWGGGFLYYHYGGLKDLETRVTVIDSKGRPVYDENSKRILYSEDANEDSTDDEEREYPALHDEERLELKAHEESTN